MKTDNVRGELVIAGEALPFVMRKSKKARHILLHVHVSGEIEVVVPWRASYRQAQAFIEQKKDWIAESLSKHHKNRALIPKKKLVSGEKLQCFGREYTLVIQKEVARKRAKVSVEGFFLMVQVGTVSQVRPALVSWYKKQALQWFTEQVTKYAAQVKSPVSRIRVVDTKTQWGSCAHYSKVISLGWRLALAPPEVAEYVVVHEVAHLQVPNHSPRFWEVVRSLDSLYLKHKLWLKTYGYTLVF